MNKLQEVLKPVGCDRIIDGFGPSLNLCWMEVGMEDCELRMHVLVRNHPYDSRGDEMCWYRREYDRNLVINQCPERRIVYGLRFQERCHEY